MRLERYISSASEFFFYSTIGIMKNILVYFGTSFPFLSYHSAALRAVEKWKPRDFTRKYD